MIRLASLALFTMLLVIGGAHADTRAVYTISDIEVDETAASVFEAQQNAQAAARRIGAQRFIEKITLPEDRAAAGGLFLDMDTADRLVAAVGVQEEVRGGGRYRGTLSVVLNPRTVRAFLEEQGVPYLDRQAPMALLVPFGNGVNDLAWTAAWPEQEVGELAPYVTSVAGTYEGNPDWIELQPEMQILGAERAVLARLSGGAGNYRVRLTLVTAAGATPMGTTPPAGTLEEAVEVASELMSETWKRDSIVRTDLRSIVEASVLYTSIAEWNTLRGALARSPLVFEFQTLAIARDGALVRFAFAGDTARLARDLRQRGVTLETDAAGWILTSAETALPAFGDRAETVPTER